MMDQKNAMKLNPGGGVHGGPTSQLAYMQISDPELDGVGCYLQSPDELQLGSMWVVS